jgi:pimeloyl-CoA synthetase
MDAVQLLVTVVSSAGGSAVIIALINGVVKQISGKATRERRRNTDLATQRIKAIEERDAANTELDIETRKRRESEEYASRLRRQLFDAGITPLEPAPEQWSLDHTVPKSLIEKGKTT